MTNFMKSAALVTLLGLGFGTAATAQSTFGFQQKIEDDLSITIDLVRAESAGTLAVFDYSQGEFGELLGTTPLNAGVNSDVMVMLDINTASTIAAVIYKGEELTQDMILGWIELDVSDS